MSGHCRFHGNFCGINITNLANHDDVRILAKKGLERCGKGHADFCIDVDLVDTLEVKLHWIFRRQNFNILAVE